MRTRSTPTPRPRLPDWLTPVIIRAIHAVARFTRPMTLGARAAIFDESGRVFLVRHSYVRGWHLPGGAVEPGETVDGAMRREVREETGLTIEGDPVLHGVFFNRAASRRDHVVVYVVRGAQPIRRDGPHGLEIVASGYFPPDALPEDATGATRRRLAEILDGAPRTADW